MLKAPRLLKREKSFLLWPSHPCIPHNPSPRVSPNFTHDAYRLAVRSWVEENRELWPNSLAHEDEVVGYWRQLPRAEMSAIRVFPVNGLLFDCFHATDGGVRFRRFATIDTTLIESALENWGWGEPLPPNAVQELVKFYGATASFHANGREEWNQSLLQMRNRAAIVIDPSNPDPEKLAAIQTLIDG